MLARFIADPRVALLGVFAILSSCSSASKRHLPELSMMLGKKVALVEVQGEPTARSVVEVALVNQLTRKGSFILVPEKDLDAARSSPAINPLDLRGIAAAAGADYALKAKVLRFDADTQAGYSTQKVEDSQLEAETGSSKTERLVRKKSMAGRVEIELTFMDAHRKGDDRTAIASHEETVDVDDSKSAMRLRPKLRFLENLTNRAFEKFFDTY